MIVILGLIISFKAFYILYLLVPLVVLWILYKENKLYFLKIFLKIKFSTFFNINFCSFVTNFLNTSCLIYPLNFMF